MIDLLYKGSGEVKYLPTEDFPCRSYIYLHEEHTATDVWQKTSELFFSVMNLSEWI